MRKIKIVNLKCGGCANKIKISLAKKGLADVAISPDEKTVYFTDDREVARQELTRLGYPEAGSAEADSLLKKAKSYVSCALGKISKNSKGD